MNELKERGYKRGFEIIQAKVLFLIIQMIVCYFQNLFSNENKFNESNKK